MRRIFALLLFVPATLGAQTRTVYSGYVASDGGVSGQPLLVGLSAGKERGIVAARLGVGFDVSGRATEETGSLTVGIGNTDADALIFLGNPRGSGSITPYALASFGFRGYQTSGSLGLAANYSYGAGFRAPVLGGISMDGEMRYRESFAELPTRDTRAISNGLELRFGLSGSFGRSARPAVRGAPRSLPRISPTASRSSASGAAAVFSASAPTAVVAATLTTAERFIGVPYTWGGNTPEEGFDCSGFVRYVFNLQGIAVPRVSADQARFGSEVPLEISALLPGDLIAFASNGRDVDHIALYAGRGRIIHSSSSGQGVRYDDLTSDRGRWYVEHMVAVRRVL